MLSIFFLLWSLLASSQQFEYQLEGSFQTRLTLQDANFSTVNYSFYWNETETEIQGLYHRSIYKAKRYRLPFGRKRQFVKGVEFSLTHIKLGFSKA